MTQDKERPDILTLSARFYKTLRESGPGSVMGWRTFRDVDIFCQKLIFIPGESAPIDENKCNESNHASALVNLGGSQLEFALVPVCCGESGPYQIAPSTARLGG